MRAKVTITLNRFPQIKILLPRDVGENLGQMAEDLGKLVQANAPVLTGNLADSVEVTKESDKRYTVSAGNDKTPAPPVEFGHKQHPGQYVPELGKRLVKDWVDPVPFFVPAIGEIVRRVKDYFT